MFVEPLQRAERRREAKGKGEKERYTHLNAEFPIIGRRDKAFCSDQCKEIEGNNRMGKTRDLFKKIRDTKGTFHAKMGTIKDTNGVDLVQFSSAAQSCLTLCDPMNQSQHARLPCPSPTPGVHSDSCPSSQ